jgi:hypothetical protein
MTVQKREQLLYKTELMALDTEPLEVYFKQTGQRPAFGFVATNNWRGYIGEWEIVDGKLYLKQLLQMGFRKTETGVALCLVPNKISIVDIFPESDGRVHADWFTGNLLCPQGDLLKDHSRSFEPRYARYRVFTIEWGILTNSAVVPGKPVDPAGFLEARCLACGFETSLKSHSKTSVYLKDYDQPVWCKDCGTLGVCRKNKNPQCCATCNSTKVHGPEWAEFKALLGDLYQDVIGRFVGKKAEGRIGVNRFGNIHIALPIYFCPKCKKYELEFTRPDTRQF